MDMPSSAMTFSWTSTDAYSMASVKSSTRCSVAELVSAENETTTKQWCDWTDLFVLIGNIYKQCLVLHVTWP